MQKRSPAEEKRNGESWMFRAPRGGYVGNRCPGYGDGGGWLAALDSSIAGAGNGPLGIGRTRSLITTRSVPLGYRLESMPRGTTGPCSLGSCIGPWWAGPRPERSSRVTRGATIAAAVFFLAFARQHNGEPLR